MKHTILFTCAVALLVACDDKKPSDDATATPTATPSATNSANAEAPKAETNAAEPAAPSAPSAPQTNGDSEPTETAEATPTEAAPSKPEWPETFGKPDAFDEASKSDEDDEETPVKLISGMKRMSAKDTLAALDEARPALDALAAVEGAEQPMPSYETVTDPTAYTTRAYPIGEHATLFLFRMYDEDDLFEDEIYKATMLYDRKNKKAVYHKGLPDWRRSETYALKTVGGLPMLRTSEYTHGGTCAFGGDGAVYVATPEGVVAGPKVSWSSTDGGSSGIIMEDNVVKVSSQPAIKKNKRTEKFTTNKIEETCRFAKGKFTCVKKVLEKNVVIDGCF